MGRRLVVLFSAMMMVASLLILRLYTLMSGEELAEAAARQSRYTLTESTARGMIYDCNLIPLVNRQTSWRAAVIPSSGSADFLLSHTEDPDEREALFTRLSTGKPFTIQLSEGPVYATDIYPYATAVRYTRPLAPHILGTVDAAGTGNSGIELGWNQLLEAHGSRFSVQCVVDAAGRAMAEQGVTVSYSGTEDAAGLVLTLDRTVQMLCENVLETRAEKGACIVMEAGTGRLRAVASTPTFDPRTVADSLEDPDAPLINRAFSGYNVGSTFKLAVAAAALEQGISPGFSYTCTGSIRVGDTVYHCHNRNGHGTLDMEDAIRVSCNPYFVHLAEEIGYTAVHSMASLLGFGTGGTITEGIVTDTGNLPDPGDIQTDGEIANLAFGQGELLATPLQIAQMVSAIVNGGETTPPQLVEGIADETGSRIAESMPAYAGTRAMSAETAARLRDWMIEVVAEGSGRRAQPRVYTAGGKTGSAQTGRYTDEGEIIHAWFAGFYPAEEPQYIIVVLIEGGGEGSAVAAPAFREICNGLYLLDKVHAMEDPIS